VGEHEDVRWTCQFCGTTGVVPRVDYLDTTRCNLCGRPVTLAPRPGQPTRRGRHSHDEEVDAPAPLPAAPSIPLDDLPRAPSGRIPQWVLDEATGRRTAPTAWRSTDRSLEDTGLSSTHTRRTSGRSRGGQITAAIVVVALVAGSWGARWWQSTRTLDAAQPQVPAVVGRMLGASPTTPSPQRAPNSPTPGFEEASTPLGTPPAVVSEGVPYTFISTQTSATGGTVPVAWSPCRPIHVAINTTGAPENSVPYVRIVMGEITRATGLQFTYDGLTDEPPTENRQPYQPDRYGDRWAPVIIGFADDEQIPKLDGDVAGVAQPMPLTRSDLDYSVITTASLWLDTTLLDEPGTASGPAWLPVLRHEFGHVIGLDHVDDPTQLMNPKTVAGINDYQSGDLYGLAQLGKGRCAPDF